MSTRKHRKLTWHGICKTGKLQSPVALNKHFAYHIPLPALKFENFKEFSGFVVKNTGVTIQVNLPNICRCDKPKISGGGLQGKYIFDHIHLCWPGEHLIDGVQFDLEIHFVFYSSKYKDLEEASNFPFGMTVMAVLFVYTMSTRTNTFQHLAKSMEKIWENPGQSVVVAEPLNLYHFLPYDHRQFYYYHGSLTTPHCVEFVHWFVMKNTNNIAYLDYRQLTKLCDFEGEILDETNRDIQPLNDRVVYLRSL